MPRGRPKGSTNHKTEMRRAREFQKWLAKLIKLHLGTATHLRTTNDPGRRLTIDLATGRVVRYKKPGRKPLRRKKVARKARRVKARGSRRRATRPGTKPAKESAGAPVAPA